jgi:hypothetical protein
MAIHASDSGYPFNICLRRDKRHTIVMKFGRGVVLVVNRILLIFLPYKSYRMGVFAPAQNLIAVKL